MPIGQTPEEPTPEMPDSIGQIPTPIPRPEQQADPAVQQVVSILRARGVPDQTIVSAIKAVQNGAPAEQIASQLGRLVGNGR